VPVDIQFKGIEFKIVFNIAFYIMQGTEKFRRKQDNYINTKKSDFLHINGLSKLRKDVVWMI